VDRRTRRPALSCSWKHRRMWVAWKQRSWRCKFYTSKRALGDA
jgi:hypothetical protein